MPFPCDPLLCFNPNDLYPTATCAIELTLPTQDNDYKDVTLTLLLTYLRTSEIVLQKIQSNL